MTLSRKAGERTKGDSSKAALSGGGKMGNGCFVGLSLQMVYKILQTS
jgi:hypothetical protein